MQKLLNFSHEALNYFFCANKTLLMTLFNDSHNLKNENGHFFKKKSFFLVNSNFEILRQCHYTICNTSVCHNLNSIKH